MLIFTTQSHPEWDQKIEAGLYRTCGILTGVKETYMPHRIYAERNNVFLGGIVVEQHGNIVWIDNLWVEPDYRKQGIGQQLAHQVSLYAAQQNAKELQLNTYFPKAHTFFLSQGFEDVAIIPNWKYGLECYLMRKQL